ncbi:MAG: 3-keto-5-aminohexanoate cleavage protein [Planctomycetes bacterium]|nr:3-keto-5-aminohexanoate cleavage protein [Planctomycetota bacterium]
MDPLIINAAVTGMVPTKDDSPNVPISPQEIIADVRRCRDAGATIVHLHAREPEGEPTYRKEIYAEIFAGVRQECPELLISASCSGRLHREFWQRSEVLDLEPDFGSLTLGSLNFSEQASVNSPEMIQRLAQAMQQRGIMAEMEIFDLGMADYAKFLVRKGMIERPLYANLLLGSLGTMSATPENLCMLIRALPEGTTWSATGIGRFQFFVNSLAVTMGGHVRVGLEDALYYDWEAKRHATNAGLIQRVVRLALAAGREIATAEQTRRIIGVARPAASPRLVAA